MVEERLKQCRENDCKSSMLLTQWEFDKKYLSQLLEAITVNFPHYSLHNVMHSQNIVTEIEKILGEEIIKKFSYIDCWLLLESAYWHDIGMFVPYEDKIKKMKEDGFKEFIDNIKHDKDNDLFCYAETLGRFIKEDFDKKLESLVDIDLAFVFLFAEYTRKKHNSKSKDILLETTQYNQLINRRLIRLLSNIIEYHGKPFDEILKMPFENDGLDVGDVAHPRLIACLLRLGDLLDLDDDRHYPELLNVIGKIPAISEAHYNGHKSILNKNINQNIIEIKSVFESKDSIFDKSFEIQNKWFSLIENEVENLNKKLNDIVPQCYSWKPPVAKLSCEISGCITIDSVSPKLKFDEDRIYNYLIDNIYNDRWSCINELLQNAVDATIDRIWIERGSDIRDDRNEFKKIASDSDKYRIDVNIETEELNLENEDSMIIYNIEIKDNGKGMNLEEIKSMFTVASKENQQRKTEYRRGMPEWMKPSGFFGIGLQSIFSKTDRLEIETSAPNDFAYKIVMKKMTSSTSYYAIERIKGKKWDHGTTVTFSFSEKKIPETLYGGVAIRELSKFDPLKDDSLDTISAEIRNTVANFAELCDIMVYFKGKCLNEDVNENKFMIVDINNGIEYNMIFGFDRQYVCGNWCYKGRPVDGENFSCGNILLGITGNIISGETDEFLSLNRNKFHDSGKQKLVTKVNDSLRHKKSEILKLEKLENKEMANLYYYLQENDNNELWREVELTDYTNGKNIKIKDLIVDKRKIGISFSHPSETINDTNNPILIARVSECNVLLKVLGKLKKGIIIHSIKKIELPQRHDVVKIYSIEVVDDVGKTEIKEPAIEFLSSQGLYDDITRYYLPCGTEQYKNISFDKKILEKYLWMRCTFESMVEFFFPKIIILPSTTEELERNKDLELLADKIWEHKKEQGEDILKSVILKDLEDFFEKFKFESKKYKHFFYL